MTTNELPREPNELDRLVTAARGGDRPAFDELVRRTYVDTYTLALRLTAHEEDARDVVQETYLRAWKGLDGFRGDAQFTTWLYRITANTAYTTVKRRRRHRADALDAMIEEPVETRIEAQPEESAEQSAALARLAGAVEHLPPKLRVLVVQLAGEVEIRGPDLVRGRRRRHAEQREVIAARVEQLLLDQGFRVARLAGVALHARGRRPADRALRLDRRERRHRRRPRRRAHADAPAVGRRLRRRLHPHPALGRRAHRWRRGRGRLARRR